MKYDAGDFAAFVAGRTMSWPDRKISSYERLAAWIEDAVSGRGMSFAELQVVAAAELGVGPDFFRRVYSDRDVQASRHWMRVSGLDDPDRDASLVVDMLNAAALDGYVCDADDVDFARMVTSARGRGKAVAVARAWCGRMDAVSEASRPRR